MQKLLHQHPIIFCLLCSAAFAIVMYFGSISTLTYESGSLLALSIAGASLGLVIALEILIIKTARKLKTFQLLCGLLGGMMTAMCIQISWPAVIIGGGIGLLLALTANKRLYSSI